MKISSRVWFSIFCVCCSIVLLASNCKKEDDKKVKFVSVDYQESTEDFPNPERGFYRYSETSVDQFEPLEKEVLSGWRNSSTSSGGNYSIFSTLVFRYYVLKGYNDKPLSADFLQKLTGDFATAREAGVKLIPRFTYTVEPVAGGCPEGFACPPYGDASKAIVLQHIGQLKPILTDNSDVIAALQMGFIGIWGENYYTDHFGDPSTNGQSKLLDSNWVDRIEVLKALLDALPKDRMVQVRTPQMKQRYVYGVDAGVDVQRLTDANGFATTDIARIGFHNDCFLSSPDDYGTYEDYGNSSSDRQSANSALRAYVESDSKYVFVGGETCDDAFSPNNDCDPTGQAQTQMKNMHYTYLNSAYNNEVNDDWQTGGCMEDIKKQLGYRYVLKTGLYPEWVKAGDKLNFRMTIENKGYASVINERPAKLILRKKDDGTIVSFDLGSDPRKWYSGEVQIEASVPTDAGMTKGKYELLLYFPDKYSSIAERPEYAIRLANTEVWEESTGYNKLSAEIDIR